MRRAATIALTLDDKLGAQKQIKALEAQRNRKRRALFDAQDRVDAKRDQLIGEIEGRLAQNATTEAVMTRRWTLR